MSLPERPRHHRFGEMFQMNPDWPGSIEQELRVREALIPEFGSNFHRLLQRMDQWINRRERHYLPIAFVPLGGPLGLGFATGILLSDLLSTEPGIISGIVRHEMGHVYDQLGLLQQSHKNWFMELISGPDHSGDWRQYQETWADAFRDWIDSDGEKWSALTPLLLPE